MKRRWLVLPIILILLISSGITFYSINSKDDEIPKAIISELDPNKITACVVEWANPTETYRYEETDAETVHAMYEALCSMKFKEEKYAPAVGVSYYIVSFIQDGEVISVFSYLSGHILIAPERYAAKITNQQQLEEAYGWLSNLYQMIDKCILVE